MTARTLIYKTLKSIPSIGLLGGVDDPRIFAKKTMTSANEEHPFLVYKLGVDANLDLAEDMRVTRQYFQVWCHDEDSDAHADYMRIDTILKEIKEAFHLLNSAVDKVYTCEFIETSQDFNDDTLNTLFKYSRFNLIRDDR